MLYFFAFIFTSIIIVIVLYLYYKIENPDWDPMSFFLFPLHHTIQEGYATIDGSESNGKQMETSGTIFVSIPSYRDKDCKNTLVEIFNKAVHPDRIYVGVFTQNSSNSDESCLYPKSTNPSKPLYPIRENQIRYLSTDYKNAKGPLYARKQIIDKLYQNETYFLMIDAHTMFRENWDVDMIRMLETLRTKHDIKKPIISSYPDTFPEYKKRDKMDTTNVSCNILNGHAYPVMTGAVKKPNGYFYKQYLFSGGGTFTYGSFYREIQIDPTLEYVFNGEEFYFTALAYTNGWDVYSFAYNCVYHMYRTNENKTDEGLDWYADSEGVRNKEKEKASHETLKKLLTDERFASTHAYRMGISRPLNGLYEELQYDSKGKTFKENWTKEKRDRLCNQLPKFKYEKSNLYSNQHW